MTRQAVEGLVLPQQFLGAVGHMLMPEWAGADGVKHGCAARAAFGLVGDSNRNPVTVEFHVFRSWAVQAAQSEDSDGSSLDGRQVLLDVVACQFMHGEIKPAPVCR